MSREDIVAVASRLFAVFVFVFTLRTVAGAVHVVTAGENMVSLATLVVIVLALLSITALLWFFPLTIARKLLPVMKEPRSEHALDASTSLSIALTAIGIWFLANAIVDATYWLILYSRVHNSDVTGFEWTPDQLANMAATIIELAISLWLIFGSTGIKHMINRIKYGKDAGAV